MMQRYCLTILATWLALISLAAAQDAPNQALDAANNIYIAGDYPAAVTAFEGVLKDYPTSPIVPQAQIQLAFAYFLTGANEKSLEILKKFSSVPSGSTELSELAALLEPQALSSLAASLKADDPKRKATYEEAVKKFGEFISKYPQSTELESAYYGSAIASFQINDYTAAKTALEANIKKFPSSPSIAESENLLALIYATEGSKLLSQEGADKEAAFALYKKSADILRGIIDKKTDLTLVNTAQFQLGEILLNEAAFAPEDRKAALLEGARDAFRGVLPKEDILALQKKKIDEIPALRRAALTARNKAEQTRLDRRAERDRRKLSELQARPDQTVTALQKVGESYFQQGKYDESRVVLAHAQPLLTDDDDKKRNLYFTTMTYALQNAAEPATSGYDAFQRSHKGDAIAANLPVALGNLYLTHPDPKIRNPEKAAAYFKEAAQLYPKSPLLGLSVVNEATARAQQGDFDGALKTYRDFLATNPPPEVGAVAQIGIGNVLKEQRKWDEAIAAYKEVITKFPKAAQVEEAEFWVAVGTQQKGDNAGALPLLEAFVQKYPDTALTPNALYSDAAAKLALGKQDEGVATLAQLAEKFPKSQPAPFTYFQRAQIAGTAQNADEVVRLMREFAGKYPDDDKVYFAYDSIGQTENNRGNADAAAAAYAQFVEKYPAAPKAPEALLKSSDIQRAAAERMGRYGALTPEEQAKWKERMAASTAAVEKMAADYPDSADLGLGLRSLLAVKKFEADAGLTDAAGVEKYFEDFAAKAPDGAKSKILFARAAFINGTDPKRALEEMNKAYNPSLVYAPSDLDLYGLALLEAGEGDKAKAVFEKVAADYPVPANTQPAQATPTVQEAQAISLFGLGRVAQENKDVATAGQLFEQLKSLYPWSPKVLEANYGIAQSLRAQGKADEAVTLLTQIVRAQNAPSKLRADAMLLGGYIQKDKGQREAAIDYFIKISAFYDGVPEAASTGLWEGGQLIEQQVAELQAKDPDKAAKQRAQAIRAYKELAEKFPDSPFAAQAKQRLDALGEK
ncbi:MAG: tetratricopeptide repeat protein [Chthoniobacterales bacterium]|nr:tetratricopeptide repeat protein [Chthoniobacterales bacterium]